MKIFISSAGDNGREIAEALHDWLLQVLHFVDPFISKEIRTGAAWLEELSTQLEKTNYGIICLTKESVAAPWIYFEAGAIAKLRESSRVSSILFGINSTDAPGPLQHFQQASFDREGMLRLVLDINSHGGENARREDVLIRLFSNLWKPLEDKIGAALQRMQAPKPTRDTNEILDDLTVLVRDQIQSSAAVSDQIAQKVLAAMGPRNNADLPDSNYAPWKNIYRQWPVLLRLVEGAGDPVDRKTWEETKALVGRLEKPMENLLKRMERRAEVTKKKTSSDDDDSDNY